MSKPILATILSCQGYSLTDDEKYLFNKFNPLGVTLFNRNIKDKKQVKLLIDSIKNTINRDDVLIAIDEEGGRVSRLKNINRHNYISAQNLATLPIKYTKMQAELISSDLIEMGINVNYSPVVDRKINSTDSSVLEKRCFSDKGEEIVEFATNMANTYINMGICPCIKHIPGHFNIAKDPHLNKIECDLSIDEIKNQIKYLKEFSKYPLAMTSHILLKSIDDTYPVTLSSKIISKLIRDYLSFDGFLLSDAIDMKAISGNIIEKLNQSLDAGIDAVCYCSGEYKDLFAICNQKRFITEKSLIRFANIKKVINNNRQEVDIKDIRKLYRTGIRKFANETYSYDATEVLHYMQKKGDFK